MPPKKGKRISDAQNLAYRQTDKSVTDANKLEKAVWNIVGHKVVNILDKDGEPKKLIIKPADDIAGIHCRLEIKWTLDEGLDPAEWAQGDFIERDVQRVDEKKVLDYWAELGGRHPACGIDPDWVHVLTIHEDRKVVVAADKGKGKGKGKAKGKEKGKGKVGGKQVGKMATEYRVQFVGYPATDHDEMAWWTEDQVKFNYPELLERYKKSKDGEGKHKGEGEEDEEEEEEEDEE